MDMARIHGLMVNLRLANEVETAAEMDVADCKANIDVYERKLAAIELRHAETVEASKEAGDALAEAVTQMVQAPLLLMLEAEERNHG